MKIYANKGRPLTEDHKRKVSEAKIKACFRHSEEAKRKMSEAKKGKKLTENHKRKISESGKGKIIPQEVRKKLSLSNTGQVRSEEAKMKIREGIKHCIRGKRPPHTPITRKKLSEAQKRYASNHVLKHTEETKRKNSTAHKILWNNPMFASKMGRSWHISPNKPETFLLSLLEELYPGEWKYTGDFSFTVNGKSPDFTNINGQKKLIELFGDYWHKGENPQDRIDVFKPFGFDTLVIWEKELKEIEAVKSKVVDFYSK